MNIHDLFSGIGGFPPLSLRERIGIRYRRALLWTAHNILRLPRMDTIPYEAHEYYDVIYASPPCLPYSKTRTE
jgi:site-specific DNA-cytosine methylase